MTDDVTFAYPWMFYALAIIPLLVVWYWFSHRKIKPNITLSTLSSFKKRKSIRERLVHFPFFLRLAALVFLIIALARPQSSSQGQNIFTEGIDIVIALDISGSMLAEDFKPNRIEAAKRVAEDFIKGRPNDRIGLVIFSGESFTQCPITTDHDVLYNLLGSIRSGLLVDGTAIGEGLATAVSRLKDSEVKSRVIILLTDGVNNAGAVDPITAGEIAGTFGIRTYTIGVGTRGMALYPVPTPYGIQYQNMEVQIDEEVLQKIAGLTGGKYFRATNTSKLREIYAEIDRLEKTRINVVEYKRYSEEFLPWLLMGSIFFSVELFLKLFFLRSVT